MNDRLHPSRRQILGMGASCLAGSLLTSNRTATEPASAPARGKKTASAKPIRGSWISIQHPNPKEAALFDPACAAFTEQDWMQTVRDQAALGFEYLVLLSVAYDSHAYYESAVFPRKHVACDDPIGAFLRASDEHGLKLFMGCGWFGNWTDGNARLDPEVTRKRLTAMGELVERYGKHKSFFGWYWPSEASIRERFDEDYVKYVNQCAAEAHRLTPGKKTLIAPYGTRITLPDDRYVRQLESMDVDIIAYQDEVGVKKTTPEELPRIYEGLRKAHDRVPQRALWADMEIFTFQGEVYKSALIPAPFSRVEKQINALSPFVDNILAYQYQGMMNPPGSKIAVGHPDSARLYADYERWLERSGLSPSPKRQRGK